MATKRAYDAAATDSSNSAKRSKLENFDSETSVRFFFKQNFILHKFD